MPGEPISRATAGNQEYKACLDNLMVDTISSFESKGFTKEKCPKTYSRLVEAATRARKGDFKEKIAGLMKEARNTASEEEIIYSVNTLESSESESGRIEQSALYDIKSAILEFNNEALKYESQILKDNHIAYAQRKASEGHPWFYLKHDLKAAKRYARISGSDLDKADVKEVKKLHQAGAADYASFNVILFRGYCADALEKGISEHAFKRLIRRGEKIASSLDRPFWKRIEKDDTIFGAIKKRIEEWNKSRKVKSQQYTPEQCANMESRQLEIAEDLAREGLSYMQVNDALIKASSWAEMTGGFIPQERIDGIMRLREQGIKKNGRTNLDERVHLIATAMKTKEGVSKKGFRRLLSQANAYSEDVKIPLWQNVAESEDDHI
ncbi:MAG: hypothetical protein V1866_02535, partial [archaeon]